jgi:hypothetical protein
MLFNALKRVLLIIRFVAIIPVLSTDTTINYIRFTQSTFNSKRVKYT